jgi:hypothetical protein
MIGMFMKKALRFAGSPTALLSVASTSSRLRSVHSTSTGPRLVPWGWRAVRVPAAFGPAGAASECWLPGFLRQG